MNRKSKIILTCITLLLVTLYIVDEYKIASGKKYPDERPELTVEYENQKHTAEIMHATWAVAYPGQYVGDSILGLSEDEIKNEMESISVKANDTINLKLSYDMNISSFEVIEVSGVGEDRKNTPVAINDNILRVPEETGEYIYSIHAMWDSTVESSHNVSYVIKLNVE